MPDPIPTSHGWILIGAGAGEEENGHESHEMDDKMTHGCTVLVAGSRASCLKAFPHLPSCPWPGLLAHWSSHVRTFLPSSSSSLLPFPSLSPPFSPFPLVLSSVLVFSLSFVNLFNPLLSIPPHTPLLLPPFLFLLLFSSPHPPVFAFSPRSPLPSLSCACDPPGFTLLVCWKCSFYAGRVCELFLAMVVTAVLILVFVHVLSDFLYFLLLVLIAYTYLHPPGLYDTLILVNKL